MIFKSEVNRVNPDYLIVDTPGQIELFAYRSSGPFLVENISSEEKTNIFLFDGALITSPVNFVSIALLATSIRLRLNVSTINVLTKTDLIGTKLNDILTMDNKSEYVRKCDLLRKQMEIPIR